MRKKILTVLTSVALLAVTALPVMAADNTIKIAYIDPLSGAFAGVGDAGYKEFQYSAELINAKGGVLGGKKLEVVPFDNKVSPQDSLIQLRRVIDQGIRIITQGNGSSVAGALIEAVNKFNERNPGDEILYLNYAAVTPAFTNELCSFWHFRFDAHVGMKIAAITNYIKAEKKIKRVYLINQDYVFGHSVSQTSQEMLHEKRPDIKIVGDTFTPLGKVKDFSPYIAQIKESKADAVITGNWGPDMSLLIKAAKDAGLHIPFLTFYGGGLGTPSQVGLAGAGILYQVTEWHSNLSQEYHNKADQKFYLGYEKKYDSKGEVPYYYGRIHTEMEMLAKAIDKAGSAKSKDIAYALEGMEYETPYGLVTMRAEDHQLIQPLFISVFSKLGGTVKYDVSNTGAGFKTVKRIEAADTALPTTCQMVRPSK
jgi:branched-chain amino acid transport system substrate-binding protein